MTDQARDRLEAIAGIYDASRDFDGVLTRYAFELLGPRLSGGRTLEMGCSSGVMTALLAARVSALEVVDGSATYLAQVRAKLGRDDVVYHHDLFEDFEPAHPYDDVVMARALEHLADPRAVLAKVARWLAPGGRLHVMVPNAWSFHRLVGVAMGMLTDPHDLSERDRAYGHHRVYDPETLREELTAAGFTVEELSGNSLKFLSNAQMASLAPPLWDAFFEVGRRFPERCAELYARCRAGGG